ncbi:MAG: peptidase M16, partial [Halioglobus sp.]|nr:peptidase M16 [Halioglobus sp.]
TGLGRAPSPLCGLEDSMREMVFCCGIEGSEAEHADALELAVLDVIERVAREGVPLERVEAVLHQLELHQREISGDSYPYGLQLILQALGSATHYADPIALLNLDPVIATLREKIRDPDYIRELARRLLLDNAHRVTLVMTPDTRLSSRRREREAQRLAAIKNAMSEEQRSATVKLAAELAARQQRVDDDSVLPRVELSDVPPKLPDLPFGEIDRPLPLTHYARGTNGIVYQQLVAPLPALDEAQLQLMPLYSHFLTELGVGELSYLQAQERQASTVGSIHAFTSMRGAVDDEQSIAAHFNLSSKALARNAREQTRLMQDVLHAARFDESERLRDLVGQQLARREQAISGNGHGLAMSAACAGMSPLAKLHHEQSGLEGILRLRALAGSLREPAGSERLEAALGALHRLVQGAPLQLLAIADQPHLPSLIEEMTALWSDYARPQAGPTLSLPALRERRGELWLANTQVNFCARAYPTVPSEHADAAALSVLGGFLRNGYLHR